MGNFDIINNDLKDKQIQKYKTVDFDEIKSFPSNLQSKIKGSIFRRIDKSNIHIDLKDVKREFSEKKFLGRGRFLKICRDTIYSLEW